ncbi:hypothetical protein GCM10009608_01940 [Pseudonocardia alaniniphila]
MHVDADELAQRRHEVLDVHAGSSVDVRGVLAGEQANAHTRDVRPFTGNRNGSIRGMNVRSLDASSGGPPRWESTRVGGVTMLPAGQGPVPSHGAPK